MELIFCGGGNPSYAQIAISCGYRYGAQLPCTIYAPLFFADQNWKKPDRKAYMAAIEKHRPTMASVMDFERPEQRAEVMSWVEQIAQFVQIVMIIPKVSGEIANLPHHIGGAEIRLGYSVPTKHGGTMLHLAEFIDWPVHLLGGSPGAQMRLYQYMNVKSADGNMMMKMANKGLFWTPGKKTFSNSWNSLSATDGHRWDGDGNYEAFRRSCRNIFDAWHKII